MASSYNLRSPAVKRLMKEAQELREATELYYAQPLDDNLFEWHFTIRGPDETDFEGGIYHGRIILPTEYPMKPPNIVLLTPNGRFEVGTKVCLSISGYHPETWQPSWSIRTALLALIGFYPSPANGAIGGLDYSSLERQQLARKSTTWKCETCGETARFLKPHVAVPKKSTSAELSSTDKASATVVSSDTEVTGTVDQTSSVNAPAANVLSTSGSTSHTDVPISPQSTASSSSHASFSAVNVLPQWQQRQQQFNPFTFPFSPGAWTPLPLQMTVPPPMFPVPPVPVPDGRSAPAPPGYPPNQVLTEWQAYFDRYLNSNYAQGMQYAAQMNASLAANSTTAANTQPTETSASSPSSTSETSAATSNTTPATSTSVSSRVENASGSISANANADADNSARTGVIAQHDEHNRSDTITVRSRFDTTGLLLRICIVLLALLLARRCLLAAIGEDDGNEL